MLGYICPIQLCSLTRQKFDSHLLAASHYHRMVAHMKYETQDEISICITLAQADYRMFCFWEPSDLDSGA